ncbi:MAG: hypothetical protein J6X30_05745, partial [Clostridia bacterium]|nr:hypothetical protein [Clostridia bacterium]
MKLSELREFAAIAGVELPAGARKAEIVSFLQKQQEKALSEPVSPPVTEPDDEKEAEEIKEEKINPAAGELLASGECGDCCGVLDVLSDGFGFLRCGPFSFAKKGMQKDVYVSIAQIHRFKLRTGDKIAGKTRPPRDGEKYAALLYVSAVN